MARVEIPEAVFNGTGGVLAPAIGASVQVNVRDGAAATVYQAATGSSTFTNPLTTDASGRIEGWMEEGSYDLVVSGTGITTYTQEFEAVSGASMVSVESGRFIPDAPVGVEATDTAALQAKLTAAGAAGGGTVPILRQGTYLTNAELTIPSNVTVEIGPGVTIKRTGTAAAKVFTNSDKSAFGANVNIKIVGSGTVDRTEGTSNDPYDNPIHLRWVDGVEVTGIRIRGGGSGCHIEACDNTRVHHNRVDSFRDKGLSCSNAAGFGEANLTNPKVEFDHNTVLQTSATKHASGSSPLLNTQPCVWDSNIVVSSVALNGNCLEVGDADETQAIGNLFVGGGVLVGSGDRVKIADNTVIDGAVAGSAKVQVSVTGANPNPTRARIAENIVYCAAADAAGISVASTGTFSEVVNNSLQGGSRIDVRAADCVVKNNTVEGSSTAGYICATGARMHVAGNTARDCGQDAAGSATTKVGFMFDSLTEPNIENNLAVSSKAATADMKNGFYVNACTGIGWRNNRSRGHTTGVVTTTNTQTWDTGISVPSVTAAATIELPMFCDVVKITGNTNITSITAAGHAGRRVSLIFTGTPTLTDGAGTLRLGANFVATADDAITLVCDGTNWYADGPGSAN